MCARLYKILAAVIITIPCHLFAESVFLKDGKILEGVINKENAAVIIIKENCDGSLF